MIVFCIGTAFKWIYEDWWTVISAVHCFGFFSFFQENRVIPETISLLFLSLFLSISANWKLWMVQCIESVYYQRMLNKIITFIVLLVQYYLCGIDKSLSVARDSSYPCNLNRLYLAIELYWAITRNSNSTVLIAISN